MLRMGWGDAGGGGDSCDSCEGQKEKREELEAERAHGKEAGWEALPRWEGGGSQRPIKERPKRIQSGMVTRLIRVVSKMI